MKLLLENWRDFLNEISFDDAKKRLETKALTSWIKGMAFDEETKTMTLDPNQIEAAKRQLAELVLEFVPEDLTDTQQGTSLEWLISVGINDPHMKQKFYNEAIASTETDSGQSALVLARSRGVALARVDLRVIRNDLERYWHTHEYSEERDIFKIKTFGALAVSADRAKRKSDAAQADKEFLDADNPGAVEVFRDDNKWRIYALHNKGAACKFGKGTEWCTAAPGLNYFEDYYEPDDPLFYFERTEFLGGYFSGRYQIHFGSEQFMDENDHELPEEDRDELIDLLAKTDAPKKYQIVRYWVERNEWMQIVYDENTTERELMVMAKRFAGEGEREVLEAITENPNVTVEILKFIAANDENGMSMAIGHEKFPFEAIEELANSEDKETRYNAVTTGRLSAETLTRLSEDEYWRVRGTVAKSQKTPPEVLAKLATDEKYEGVVDALLRNRSLPSELFEPILKRAEEEDAKGAVKSYKTRAVDGGEWRAPPARLYWNAQVVAASNPQAPEELLRAIVADSLDEPEDGLPGWHVRGEVARNPSTPLDLLQALAKDEIAHVRDPAKRALDIRGEGLESLAENFKRFLK
tara:strand:- start:968 stop:2713 length:1746 start_codon:yes stop_codon:yes gene_type:complete